jgi:uncharacterized protein (DUF58 family)
VPTKSGVAVAVAAVLFVVLGWLADYPELVAVGVAGLAALVLAAAWMLLRPDLAASREIRPQRVTAGDSAFGVLTITNEGKRRSPPIMASEAVAGQTVVVAVPALKAGTTHSASYRLPTGHRGVHQVGPLTIGHSDPLRLMRIGRDYTAYSTLYVHPRMRPVEPVPTGQTRDMDGPTSSFSAQGGVAFHSLRDYVPGDDWRQIHWKSTARTGELMVRHNVVPNEPRLLVVLDTSADSYTGETFENAVSAAASLAVAAIRGGFPLELRTTGGEAVAAERGGEGAVAVLDLLASTRTSTSDDGLAALPGMVALEDSVSLGVVTGQPEPRLLTVLPAVRRHFLMVSLVQFLDRFDAPPAALNGVVSMTARTLDEFATTWNRLVRT